jgi:cleavage and polyadenylation specificity factor subunit 1
MIVLLQVVTTFELPGCVDMWTVIGMKDSVEDPSKGEQEYTHAFMILSQQDSTMVHCYIAHSRIPCCL